QALASIFAQELKPYEVEICVAEVGQAAEQDQMFRVTYDGSIVDEPRYMVMGGNTDPINTALKDTYSDGMDLSAAVNVAVRAPITSSSDVSNWRYVRLRCSAPVIAAMANRSRERVMSARM